MENNNFDPNSEFEQATEEPNLQKKSSNPFAKLFSKSKDKKPKKEKKAKKGKRLPDVDMEMNMADRFDHDHDDSSAQDEYDLSIEQLREQASADTNDSPRTTSTSKSELITKILKGFAVVLMLIIIGLLAYFFFFSSSDAPEIAPNDVVEQIENVPAAPTPSSPDESEIDVEGISPADLAAPDVTADGEEVVDETTNTDQEVESEQTAVNQETETSDSIETKSELAVADTSEEILKAEIPKDEALVKEELDKLEDQGERLEKQEKLLTQRVEMMDELTKKKAEQIALLEKQIAEMETKDAE